MLAQYSFSNDYIGIAAQGFGTRDGQYAPGFAGSIDPAANTAVDYTGFIKTVSGLDHATSAFVQYSAPGAARVVTPLTTLLRYSDQVRVKRQLALDSAIDLLTYDAVADLQSTDPIRRQRARAVLVANLNAQAIGLALGYIENGPNPYQGDVPRIDYVGALLSRAPDRFVLNDTDLGAVLQEANAFYARGLRLSVITAAAHLLNTFAQAAGADVINEGTALQYNAAAYGLVLPELKRLFLANSDAAAVAVTAIASPQIRSETIRFQEAPAFNATGLLFPALDYYRIAPGATLTLLVNFVPTARFAEPDYVPNFNDNFVARDSSSTGYRFFTGPTLRSVSVPAINAGEIDVTRQPDGTVRIVPASAFRGVSYFDYVVEANGESRTGRSFVIVR